MPGVSAVGFNGTWVSQHPVAPVSQVPALGYLGRWTCADDFFGTWVVQASVLEAFDAWFPKRYCRNSVQCIAGHLTDQRG